MSSSTDQTSGQPLSPVRAKTGLQNLYFALDACCASGNWHGALAIALLIPDVCGWMQYPKYRGHTHTGARYKQWIEEFVPRLNVSGRITSSDVYALRCAYLHQGSSDIDEQKARESFDKFLFVVPKPGAQYRYNKIVQDGKVALQIEAPDFCSAFHKSFRKWYDALPDTTDRKRDEFRSLAIWDMNTDAAPPPGWPFPEK